MARLVNPRRDKHDGTPNFMYLSNKKVICEKYLKYNIFDFSDFWSLNR